MLDHHIQRAILYKLAFAEDLTFSELKPDILDNKLFTYHLHKVIKAGYAHKSDAGRYALTPLGRQLGIRAVDKTQTLASTPDSVLFLIVRRASDGAWLLYRRNTHPLRFRIGFMHCLPESELEVAQTAQHKLLRKTGLSGTFTALGGGYIRIRNDEAMESFTHFTLLVCEDATGELTQGDEYADYFWEVTPDFNDADFFPTTGLLLEKYHAGQPFFVEQSFTV